MGVPGLGSKGIIRKPSNNYFVGLDVPKPLKRWRQARRIALERGDIANWRDLRSRGEFHITVIGPQELRALGSRYPELFNNGFELPLIGSKGIRYRGIGRAEKNGKIAYYTIVDWKAAQEFRAEYGLRPYHLHVTLGFVRGDVYNVPKDVSTKVSTEVQMERFAGMTRREIQAGPLPLNNLDLDLLMVEEEIYGLPLSYGQEVYIEDLGHFDTDPRAHGNREGRKDHGV